MNRAGWSFTAVLSLSSILAGLQTGCVQQKFSRSDSFKDSLSAEQIAALQKRQAPANKLRKSFNLKMEQGHLVDAGKDLDALEAYLRVIQMDGIHSEAKLLRAIWYVESGDNSAALARLNDVQAQINLGTESLAAIILARNKIKAEPPFDFLRLLNARKFAGSELTETDIPKQDFTGQEATAWIYYACEYKMVGNKVWENRLLRRSLSLCKSPLAQYLVAQNLREEGQYEKAKEMLEQISSSCSPGLRRQIDKLGQKVRDALEVEQTRKALF